MNIKENLKYFKSQDFIFDPIKHKYYLDGEEFISVTRYIQKFHNSFDKEYWANIKAKKRGITKLEILKEWQESNDLANSIGTKTHEWIEDYLGQKWRKLPDDLEIINRINKFNVFYSQKLSKLEPVAQEIRVFSKKWKIAGMIDSIFTYKDKILILDWKTNKNFTTEKNTKYNENLLFPFDSFLRTHLSEYSIQLSLYSLILEECGLNVHGSYLVHIGPGDQPAKMYEAIDMKDILRKYLSENSLL